MHKAEVLSVDNLTILYKQAQDVDDVDLLKEIEAECLQRERLLLRNGWDLTTLAYGGLAIACRLDIDAHEGGNDGAE